MIGQYLMSFDLLELRERGDFHAGVDNSRPKIEGTLGENFGYKTVIRGRYTIDTMPFSLNNLPTPDNRLETIARFFGIEFRKSISYSEMNRLSHLASQSDKLAAQALLDYNYADAVVSLNIGRRVLSYVLPVALADGTDPTTACFKSDVGSIHHDNEYFKKLHTFRRERKVGIDIEKKKLAML